MDSRERLLTALNNEKPDHLPCQVHGWMDYYMKEVLHVKDQFEAYERFPGMDWVIYANPDRKYNDKDLANWIVKTDDLGTDEDGVHHWHETYTTPEGTLTQKFAANQFTRWETEHIIKNEHDFELWEKYFPIPEIIDWAPIIEIKNRIGAKGIVRGGYYGFGQGSPWQDFCIMAGTEEAIMWTFDKPDFMHHVMSVLLEKKLKVIERGGKFEMDLVETGGGAASSTVISPTMHKEFCLPYDQKQIAALHNGGTKVVYHLCGGLMPLLETVAENGADGLETMTPASMGADVVLEEATKRVGDKLFFIGGFDQNAGFEKGTPESAAAQVKKLHAACPDGGYICCASDHFFFGEPENIQGFVDECNRSTYA